MDEYEFLEWIHDHRARLHEISARLGADERVTRGVALMVLSGYTDEEVYEDLADEVLVWDGQHSPDEDLADEVLVWDGQHSPLRQIPDVLAEVRRAVIEEADLGDGGR
jgi:hypothetical protein